MNKYRLGLVLVVIALLAGSGAVSAQPAPASVPVTIDQQLWAEMLREFGEIPLTDRQRALVHALLQNVQREAQAREARAKDEAKPKAAENPKP